MSSIDQQFVEFIVKSLVGEPDNVSIERRIDEKGVLLELSVAPDDLGRVIGKRGATAQSIRTLLRALGTKNDARYNLKIVDPEGANRPAPTADPADDNDDSVAPTVQDDLDENLTDDTPAELGEETPSAELPMEEAPVADEPSVEETDDDDDRLRRTREELKEFDDLDI